MPTYLIAGGEGSELTWIFNDSMLSHPRWVLVLSGGGARGITQVGVLRVLEREGLLPTAVVGTSIGAIIGALWCAGYTADEIDSLVRRINWDQLLKIGEERSRGELFLDQKSEFDRTVLALRMENFEPVLPEAISGGYRFERLLTEILWKAPYHCGEDFDRLRIPFRAIATDLVNGRSVALRRGDLVNAVRASCTFPLRFAPVRIDSMILIDGGVLANIPVDFAYEFNPDFIVVVNTTAPLLPVAVLDKPWNVADQVVTLMMQRFYHPALKQAWLTITPALGEHSTLDFSNLDTLISKGEIAGKESIRRLKVTLSERRARLLQDCFPRKTLASLLRSQLPQSNSVILDEPIFNDHLTDHLWSATERFGYVLCSYDSASGLLRMTPSTDRRIDTVSASPQWLKRELEFLRGQYYSRHLCDSVRTALQRQLRAQDLAIARVTFRFDSSTHHLVATLDSGRLVAIEFIGNKSIGDKILRNEMEIDLDMPLRSSHVLKSWERLTASDLFSSIQLTARYIDSAHDRVVLTVRVRERGSQLLRIGGRIDNERNVQPTLELVDMNVWSSGLRLLARIGGGSRNSIALLRCDMPRIMEGYWTASTELYWDSRNLYLYRSVDALPPNRYERLRYGERLEQRYGMRVSAGSNITTLGKIALGARYEHQRSFQLGDYSVARIFSPLLAVSIGTTLDDEDRADFPTRGSYASIRFERAIGLAGMMEFFKSDAFLRMTTPVASRHILRWSVRFGIASSTLPLPESFNMGGEDIFYGMREEEERGRQILVAQLEYRLHSPWELLFPLYVHLRYDAGAVWQTVQAIKLDNLKHGIGTSISFDTPIGPARFSLGQAFYFRGTPTKITLGPLLSYFSIGMRIQ